MKKSEFLGPRETFEVYEKRAHSLNNTRPLSASQMLQQQQMAPTVNARNAAYVHTPSMAYVPVVEQTDKRKVPLGLIIGLAVAVPIFVILMLFLAVWLQEMGII